MTVDAARTADIKEMDAVIGNVAEIIRQQRAAAELQERELAPVSPSERRTDERLALALAMSYTIGMPSDTMRGATRTYNVSRKGVSFKIPRMVPLMTVCQLSVVLPGQADPVSFLGRVAWCAQRLGGHHREPYLVGVEFTEVELPGHIMVSRYYQYIASHLVMKYLR